MLSHGDITIRLLLALAASALIGIERERHKHPAGMRTHMLVCIGSTLITLISVDLFADAPPVIAAGIITGVGFLGAGTIFRDKNHIRGLTTAASIWAVAGVGLAFGAGGYFMALIGTATMLFTLELGRIQEFLIRKKKRSGKR